MVQDGHTRESSDRAPPHQGKRTAHGWHVSSPPWRKSWPWVMDSEPTKRGLRDRAGRWVLEPVTQASSGHIFPEIWLALLGHQTPVLHFSHRCPLFGSSKAKAASLLQKLCRGSRSVTYQRRPVPRLISQTSRRPSFVQGQTPWMSPKLISFRRLPADMGGNYLFTCALPSHKQSQRTKGLCSTHSLL